MVKKGFAKYASLGGSLLILSQFAMISTNTACASTNSAEESKLSQSSVKSDVLVAKSNLQNVENAKKTILDHSMLDMQDLQHFSDDDIMFLANNIYKTVPVNILLRSGGMTWSRYYHNHDGYSCYKISQKMTPKEVKDIAKNSRNITNVTELSGILGGMYKGWIGGLIELYGWNVSNQLAPFRAAAKKGKGLQYSYINHSSNFTTDSYNTNETFKQI